MNRRKFLQMTGLGAVAIAIAPDAVVASQAQSESPSDTDLRWSNAPSDPIQDINLNRPYFSFREDTNTGIYRITTEGRIGYGS